MSTIRIGLCHFTTANRLGGCQLATDSELVDNILRVYQQTIADFPFSDYHRHTDKLTVSH